MCQAGTADKDGDAVFRQFFQGVQRRAGGGGQTHAAVQQYDAPQIAHFRQRAEEGFHQAVSQGIVAATKRRRGDQHEGPGAAAGIVGNGSVRRCGSACRPDVEDAALFLAGAGEAVVAEIAQHVFPRGGVVHLYGNPAKLDEITAICREHDVPLIEDAAEALGSTYNGQKCGTFGEFGGLSFNGNKIITTSGGGMLLCRTADEAKHALKLSTQARENAPWYQHEEIGYNYRMSNICAGIGRGQMKVLPLRVEQKRAIFARYCENLKGLPLTMQPEHPCAESNRWLSVALLDEGCGVTPGEMLAKLNEAGIEGRYLWKPMHLQPVFAGCPFVSVSDAPVGDDLFARGVCLPSDTKMSMDDVDRVCEAIRGMF